MKGAEAAYQRVGPLSEKIVSQIDQLERRIATEAGRRTG